MGVVKAVLAIVTAIFGYTLGRDLAHKTTTQAGA